MGVYINGVTPISSTKIFPYKPSSYWGTPHDYGNPPEHWCGYTIFIARRFPKPWCRSPASGPGAPSYWPLRQIFGQWPLTRLGILEWVSKRKLEPLWLVAYWGSWVQCVFFFSKCGNSHVDSRYVQLFTTVRWIQNDINPSLGDASLTSWCPTLSILS